MTAAGPAWHAPGGIAKANRALRIAFLHPDLGIGGAERLAVDAAVALASAGHDVTVYTSHHDRERCFEQTRDGSLDVRVHGDFLPRQIANRLLAPCAVARTACAAWALARARPPYDVVFCDLVAHVIPIARASGAKVLFYCHFPDKWLTPQGGLLRRLYREPLDRLEERGMTMADHLLVNSRFTASVCRQAFPRLAGREIEILYPGVDPAPYRNIPPIADDGAGQILLLSISRFESRKGLDLAVAAFAGLRELVAPAVRERLRLVLAGGYDARLADNRDTLRRLEMERSRRGLASCVRFETSVSEARRRELLAEARCVVYTPRNEHFGYVPIEAMMAARPVVVADSGGPLESVVDGASGFVREPAPSAFAEALARLVGDTGLAAAMGAAGRRRAEEHFSSAIFAERLRDLVRRVASTV